MKKSTRQIIEEYLEENDLSLPIEGSVRSFCRDLASDHEYTANAFRHTYYRMLDDLNAESESDDAPPEIAPPQTEEPPTAPLGVSDLERDYFYNELADLYLVWLPHRPRVLQVEGEVVREMKRAYSSMPYGYDTINEICQRFGWRRKDFTAFKRVLGWTHDQDPYTDEEHARRSTPDLVADYASMKRGEFERALRKKEWAETIDKAKAYDEILRTKILPLGEHVYSRPPRAREEIPEIAAKKASPFMAIFSPADAHLHKAWADGRGFDRVYQDLIDTTDDLAARVLQRGRPDRVVLVLGNDWSHIDTPSGATTRGTPQDVDGLPGAPLVAQGYEVAAEIIDRLRRLGPVEVIIVPSNHGEWSDYHLHAGLRFGYRNEPDVKILYGAEHRQYLRYGENLIGLEHGDGPREQDLPLIMATEARRLWGETSYHYWLTAHRHHLKEQDLGAIVMQAPSLSGTDRWHSKKGYVTAQRANICYIFDKKRGHTDRLLSVARE